MVNSTTENVENGAERLADERGESFSWNRLSTYSHETRVVMNRTPETWWW
jgi:hypothetical protein